MKSERGAVLLYVLLLVGIMSAAVITATRTMQVDISGAYIFRNDLQARSLALSGLEVARLLVYQDMVHDSEEDIQTDTLQDLWANFEAAAKEYTDEFRTGSILASSTQDMTQGGIVDEQGKLPVNLLRKSGTGYAQVLSRLMTPLLNGLVPEKQLETLPDCLAYGMADWLDKDVFPSEHTASCPESIEQLESNEGCPNQLFQHPEELLTYFEEAGLTNATAQALYYGHAGQKGLKDLTTLFETDGININTAPVEILIATAQGVESATAIELARSMDAFRRDPWNKDVLMKRDWYRELAVEGASEVSFPGAVSSSRFFSVRATGVSGAVTSRAFCWLVRNSSLNSDVGMSGNVRMYGTVVE